MEKQDLINLKTKISKLSDKEKKLRDLYLRRLANGELQGQPVGYPSIDKLWLKEYPEQAIIEEFPKQTLYDAICESIKDHENDIFLIFYLNDKEQVEITGRELLDNIELVADNLLKRGINPKDKVAISFANTPESIYVMYALNKIGAVICPIDPRSNLFNLEHDLIDLDAKTYIGILDTAKTAKKVAKKVHLENIIFVSPLNALKNTKLKKAYELLQMFKGNFTIKKAEKWRTLTSSSNLDNETYPNFQDNQVAIICYTGGTTGIHKGVEITNEAMNNLIYSHKYLVNNIDRQDTFMNILPQFMIFGLFTVHLAICRGLKTYLLVDSSPENFVKHLVDINPAMAFGGPIHWETLIDNPLLAKGSLSNLRVAVTGGEKLPLAKEVKINETLKKIEAPEELWNGFGASELSGSVTLKRGKRDRDGTVGKLHVYDNAMVVDEEGNELLYGEIGELYILTSSLMNGYYNNATETENAIYVDEHGQRWFRTGDLALIDLDGNIEITGRKKRLFVSGVVNVYPFAIEEIVSSLPNVKKCLVTNVPDPVLRDVPKIHIVLENDTEENRKTIIKLIKKEILEKLFKEAIPKYFEFHEELLYTPNGKIDYKTITVNDSKEKTMSLVKTKI